MTNEAEPAIGAEKLSEVEIQMVAAHWASAYLYEGLGEFFIKAHQNPEIANAAVTKAGAPTSFYGSPFAQEMAEAIQKGDLSGLTALWAEFVRRASPTKNDLPILLTYLDELKAQAKKGLETVSKQIKVKKGRRAKLPQSDQRATVELADRLRPVCLSILEELGSATKHTLDEILDYQRVDFPEESAFLARHKARVEDFLKDPALLERAQRHSSRARLMADALAGAEAGLTLRTSIERVREARRMFRRTEGPKPEPAT